MLRYVPPESLVARATTLAGGYGQSSHRFGRSPGRLPDNGDRIAEAYVPDIACLRRRLPYSAPRRCCRPGSAFPGSGQLLQNCGLEAWSLCGPCYPATIRGDHSCDGSYKDRPTPHRATGGTVGSYHDLELGGPT